MSEYLRQQGALIDDKKWKPNNTYDARRRQIAIIQDFLNGYEAIHAKNRWKTSSSQLADDDWYKMYVSFGYLKKIINELKILAPMMNEFDTDDEKKIKILKKSLSREHLNWNQLLYEIYETLETKGDFFAYWSTNESSKKDGIPTLRVLETENMEDILINPLTNEPEAYVYKEYIIDKVLNEENGEIEKVDGREVTWIFKRGYVRVDDPIKYKDTGYRIFRNKPEYSDIIRIVHIPSFKKQSESFSRIPAADYIDPALLLAKTDTNRDVINDHLGFPFPFIIGGRINENDSLLIPGGAGYIDPEDWVKNAGKMPEVIKMEINNELQSIIDEKADAVADLYKKACLMREGLEEKVSSSDSSRNISQLRLGIEQKNKHYYNSIAQGFAPYFFTILNENKKISKKEYKDKDVFTFKVPDVLINNSLFDDLLITSQKRALGLSTLEEELLAEGKTKEQIKKRKELVNEELYGKNNDMSYVESNQMKDVVANGANSNVKNLDNNFK